MLLYKRIIKSILKYKTSSILTIISLVISFLGIIFLVTYVSFEIGFDKFHKDRNSIYRLHSRLFENSLPAVMGDEIIRNIPEVEELVKFNFRSGNIKPENKGDSDLEFPVEMLYANESFFTTFSFPLLAGQKEKVLVNPNTVVLTRKLAHQIFDTLNPVGNKVLINNQEFIVDGVMDNFPRNSSFREDCIASFSTLTKNNQNSANKWSEWSFNIFLKLKGNAVPDTVSNKIENIPLIAQRISESKENYSSSFFYLMPLSKIHYFEDRNYNFVNRKTLNIFIIFIIVIGIMGAANFVNFITSQASLRGKSLSVIRIFGKSRSYANSQILLESIILSVIAFAVSIFVYFQIFNNLENLFQIDGLDLENRYHYLIYFILFSIIFGLIAGLYPAFFVTSNPIPESLKGKITGNLKGKKIRSALVTLQFVITIVLLSVVFFIHKQLKYWHNFDIGINKENIVNIPTTWQIRQQYEAFANELQNNGNIIDYTYSQSIPGSVGMSWGRTIDGKYYNVTSWPVDYRFLDFFDIQMIKGHNFRKNSEADINTIILNEKAASILGWEDPMQRKFPIFGSTEGDIIGVAKDFNFASLKQEVGPMLFWMTNSRKYNLLLKINPGNYTQTLDYIRTTAKKFDPEFNSDIRFLDESLNRLYEKEENMARFVKYVAVWCVFLAITGLLGLVIFICHDKTKEIGIRKINGSTISNVVTNLNLDIIKWIVIAHVISCPISWYILHKWLENFAFKTSLSWWVFLKAGFISLIISIVATSWQTWLAAKRNPVEALRYE